MQANVKQILVDSSGHVQILLWFSSSHANCNAHSGRSLMNTPNMRYYSSKIQPCFLSFMYLECLWGCEAFVFQTYPNVSSVLLRWHTWTWAPHASGLASWGIERGAAPGGPGWSTNVSHWNWNTTNSLLASRVRRGHIHDIESETLTTKDASKSTTWQIISWLRNMISTTKDGTSARWGLMRHRWGEVMKEW